MAGAADLIVLIHFLFVVFVVLGGFVALKWPWVCLIHLPAAVWGLLIELFGWVCPLTPLEKYLRESAGEPAYDESFIQHYVYPLLYPDDLTRSLQWLLGACVLLVNLIVYGIVLYRFRAGRGDG